LQKLPDIPQREIGITFEWFFFHLSAERDIQDFAISPFGQIIDASQVHLFFGGVQCGNTFFSVLG
jgi:hypothetical protein